MRYFYIEPEVAGGIGPHTIMDRDANPPVITRLHYQFDGWLGDSILESFPAFIVTDGARDRFEENKLTGVQYDAVEITKSNQFEELYPEKILPKFVWLKVLGQSGLDDFGLAPDKRLIISEKVLEILNKVEFSNALIEPFQN